MSHTKYELDDGPLTEEQLSLIRAAQVPVSGPFRSLFEDDFLTGVTCNPDAPEGCESCQ